MGRDNTIKQLLKQATDEELKQECKSRHIALNVKKWALTDILRMTFNLMAIIFMLFCIFFIWASCLKMGLFSAVLPW